MHKWNMKHIQQLHKQGKIRGYQVSKESKTPRQNEKPKAVIWLEMNLRVWGLERGWEMKREYRFDEVRKWRFDFAFIDQKLAVEYEGIFGKGKSRHTTVNGYTGDTEKYNQAAAQGWKVFRVTAKNYKTIIQTLNEAIDEKH
jgi:very-short-patch-repair endonuclease